MNLLQKSVIINALELSEASMKRGINTTKNPKFKAVYEQELQDVREVQVWVQAHPLDEAVKK